MNLHADAENRRTESKQQGAERNLYESRRDADRGGDQGKGRDDRVMCPLQQMKNPPLGRVFCDIARSLGDASAAQEHESEQASIEE